MEWTVLQTSEACVVDRVDCTVDKEACVVDGVACTVDN